MDGAERSSRGRLRLLLASSSVAALLIGGGAPAAFAGTCAITPPPPPNPASSISNPSGHTINCINIQNNYTVTGNVTNAGTITTGATAPPTTTGITINHSRVGGAVVNSGQITSSTAGNGILVTNNAAVSGGIFNSNTGTITGGSNAAGIIVTSLSTFGGGISNNGTISVGGNAIFVGATGLGTLVSTFTGAISNSGTISAGPTGRGIDVSVVVQFGSSAGGGITNSGSITSGTSGVRVVNVATFTGNIVNSGTGTIASGGTAISVLSISTFSGTVSNGGSVSGTRGGVSIGDVTSFIGSVLNTGIVNAFSTGISLSSVLTFTGNVTNSGTVSSASAEGIAIANSNVFTGSVVNATGAAISAGNIGILVAGVSSFTGNISNAGTVTVTEGSGIFVGGTPFGAFPTTIATFSGNIVNGKSGVITALDSSGIFVGGSAIFTHTFVTISTFAGSITNAGTITSGGFLSFPVSPAFAGILVGGNVVSGGSVTVGTFTGNISNSGAISALRGAGIEVGGLAIGNNPITASSLTISTFGGGITNAGTIAAALHGIVVGGVAVQVATSASASVAISSFGGGIANSGRITAHSGNGVFVGGVAEGSFASVTIGTFTGGITNSGAGTISAHFGNGILVGGVASGGSITISNFQNGITNLGTISTSGVGPVTGIGIMVGGAAGVGFFTGGLVSISTFGGGITNSGTITASEVGILVGGAAGIISAVTISTFGAGIVNLGTIVAGTHGIFVGGVASGTFASVAVSSFGGGIINSGAISASNGNGIFVGGFAAGPLASVNIGTFSGGIINAANHTIAAAGNGIEVGGSAAFGAMLAVSNFMNGITNNGTITASNGIVVGGTARAGSLLTISNFANGIVNNGLISAHGAGIEVGGSAAIFSSVVISTFSGGITNAGTISTTARSSVGIFVGGSAHVHSQFAFSTFSGGISNAGTITAGTAGFGIQVLNISTFLGGITHTGSISAGTGIAVTNAGAVSVYDAGFISGSGGTAVDLSHTGPGNAFTLGTTYSFGAGTEFVTGSGSDTFQLGGTGTGTFNLSNIGTQITGFTTFNVIPLPSTAVTWIATGTGNESWTIFNGATLQLGNGGSGANAGAINGNVTDNGTFAIDRADTYTYAGNISGSGVFVQMGSGTTVLTGINSYSGGTLLDAGTLQVTSNSSIGSSNGAVTFNGGIFQAGAAGLSFANAIVIDASTGTIDTQSNTLTLSGSISDGAGSSGGLTKIGSGTLVLSGASSYTGATNVNAGTLQAGAANVFAPASAFTIAAGAALNLNNFNQTLGSLAGAGNVALGSGTLTAGGNNASTTYSGVISGSGGFNKLGSGTLVFVGTDTYTGVTNVNSGTLAVDGAITSSSAVNVNAGATLTGTGTVDPNTVTIASGATFTPGTAGVPGTSMTIAGNLALQSAALYVVYLNSSTATFANVTGTAALGGAVDAVFLPGTSVGHYTILESSGLNGSTFAGLTAPASPNLVNSLSYTADDVLLNVTAALGLGTPLNVNQQNVATTLNNVFNTTGVLPANFLPLYSLTGTPLTSALSRLDGEAATGAEHGAIELTNEFLALMLDPFVYGRGGPASGGGALGFAPDQDANLPAGVALAYAGILKAPPKPAASSYQPWTVWGASFGGSASFDGNAAIGSTDITASTYGFAAGADYHAAPDAVLGFALAGSGTNWSLAQALGTGRSDAFQAGLYGTKYFGPAYLGAALSFTNNWFTTNRTAFAGDQLTASFDGQSFGVRVEGGYRFTASLPSPASGAGLGWRMGVTPYAAIQAQSFHTPTYSETDLTGGGFGLTYNAMNATDTRSELGARFDDQTWWGAMPVQLRARLAWAHDWVSDPALSAVFQALPGSSFIVNGAPVPHDSALTTVGAELHLTPRWTLLGKFDGEFATSAQTYGGSGTLRYQW